MSDQIYWILEVAILPGKLEDFRGVARDLVASTEPEAGTLGYEWCLNEEKTVCRIYERYAHADAVLIHVRGFAAFAGRFMAACQPTSFHVYGTPNDAVKAALADLNPTYFSLLGGFSRYA
jgi:quinol monooxygenase YgiN